MASLPVLPGVRWTWSLSLLLVLAAPGLAFRITPPTESWRGTVLEVLQPVCPMCHQTGVQAMVRLENEKKLTVVIAPKAYLDLCDFRLRHGDVIDLTGELTRKDGSDVLIAYTLKRGNETLTLRDSAGRPMWESRRCTRCGF